MSISIQIIMKNLGLIFSLLTVVNLLPSAQAEQLTATGTVSASCAFLSNNAGTLVSSNDLKELGTVYGSQPQSINYTVAVLGNSVMDYSEPSTLSLDGNDISADVTITETVAYRDSSGNELSLVNPSGLVQLTTSVYDFSQDLSISKVNGSEFVPGDYAYSKTVTCVGGVIETTETPVDDVPVE